MKLVAHTALVWFLGLALLTTICLIPAAASERYKPGSTNKEGKGTFAAISNSGKAKGKFSLGRSGIRVQLEGLKPNAVYTVSLVKVRPYALRGVPPVKFTAGKNGEAAVSLRIPEKSYKAWQLLLVSYLPTGNPADSRARRPILRAKL